MNIGKQFLGQFSPIGELTSTLKITNWSKCQQLSWLPLLSCATYEQVETSGGILSAH